MCMLLVQDRLLDRSTYHFFYFQFLIDFQNRNILLCTLLSAGRVDTAEVLLFTKRRPLELQCAPDAVNYREQRAQSIDSIYFTKSLIFRRIYHFKSIGIELFGLLTVGSENPKSVSSGMHCIAFARRLENGIFSQPRSVEIQPLSPSPLHFTAAWAFQNYNYFGFLNSNVSSREQYPIAKLHEQKLSATFARQQCALSVWVWA